LEPLTGTATDHIDKSCDDAHGQQCVADLLPHDQFACQRRGWLHVGISHRREH
jgi:hypothetical protein